MDLDGVCARTREISRSIIAEDAAGTDAESRWPERGIRALQESGIGGLVVPEGYGGLGQGVLGMIRVCEEIGRECASTAISFGMHLVGSAVLSAKATPDQIERYLRPIAEGRHLTTLSLSEPGTGSEFYLPETRLARDGEQGYRVSGTKSFVTNGSYADSYVVSAIAPDEELPLGQFSMVMISLDSPGLEWGPPWEGFGMRGNQSRQLRLQDVPVPARDRLGEEGDQIWYVFHVVAPYFLSAMSGTYLGVATRALEEARTHLTQRRHSHSGLLLSHSPVLQQRLSELWAAVERTRRYLYWAAEEYDRGGENGLTAVLLSKAEAADCVVRVTNEALTLTGGVAYGRNSTLCRLLRDARASHVMAPTTDYLRMWAGRVLLGVPVLGES